MSHRIYLLVVVLVGWAPVAWAQVEEEDPAPRKPLKKIEVPDELPTKVGNSTVEAPSVHPALAAFSVKFAVPHDRLTLATGTAMRIVPVPLVFGKDKYPDEFGIQPLDDRNDTGELQTFTPVQVRSIVHFEQYAILESDNLLKLAGPNAPSKVTRFQAIEKALESVSMFHVKAVEQERRLGKNWERLAVALQDKLLETRLALAREAAAVKDWKLLRETVLANSERYRTQPKVLAELAGVRLLEAEDKAQRDMPTDWEQAAALLRDYETQHPKGSADLTAKIRTALNARAKQLLDQARAVIDSNPSEARNLLHTAEVIDPTASGLQELRGRMRTGLGTLVVGTRRMPERMSPALARFDSEKQAVELMFEGLLEAVPDETLGSDYRPALALSKPRGSQGVREFQLHPQATWADPDNTPLSPADVFATLQLQREKRHTSGTVGDRLEGEANDDRGGRLRFTALPPDPRDWLAFKVIPGRWMRNNQRAWDDEPFAKNPFGSGPYRLPPGFKPTTAGTPKDLEFVPNAGYAKRHPGQPTIREIRFTEVAGVQDLVAEFRNDRVHILTDVTTADLPKYEALPNAVVVTSTDKRRFHYLAVNHRIAALQSPDLRRGIQAAIDREAILNDVFRAGQAKIHKAMSGPFPPESWAVPKGNPTPLFQSGSRIAGGTPLTLLYPNDEPQVKAACERIARQVTAAGLPLKAEGLPPRDLLTRVELEHRYDLAYLAYDSPHDWYPLALAQFLDGSAADRGGRNLTGYLAPGTNANEADRKFAALLSSVGNSRDFDGVWKPRAWEIQAKFAEVVPFVPLWQLDRHVVISKNVKLPYPPKLLNPTTLFADVRNWKFIESK